MSEQIYETVIAGNYDPGNYIWRFQSVKHSFSPFTIYILLHVGDFPKNKWWFETPMWLVMGSGRDWSTETNSILERVLIHYFWITQWHLFRVSFIVISMISSTLFSRKFVRHTSCILKQSFFPQLRDCRGRKKQNREEHKVKSPGHWDHEP